MPRRWAPLGIGYTNNGVSLNQSGRGAAELTHMRRTADAWRNSGPAAKSP